MKYFLYKIFVYFVLLVIFDLIFLVPIFIAPTLEYDKRLEKLINNEINHKIIVLGSSRAARNILAGQIADSMKTSAFNLGFPGSDISFHYYILKQLIKHNNNVETVIFTVDEDTELKIDKSLKFRSDRLYPLVKYDLINNQLIQMNEQLYWSKFFNSVRVFPSNFHVLKNQPSFLDTIDYSGSMPLIGTKKEIKFGHSMSKGEYNKGEESDDKVKLFSELVRLCVVKSIKLVVVFSPNYMSDNVRFESRIKDLTYKNGGVRNVSFFKYSKLNEIYQNPKIYYDHNHLNKNGAICFTNEIIFFLKHL